MSRWTVKMEDAGVWYISENELGWTRDIGDALVFSLPEIARLAVIVMRNQVGSRHLRVIDLDAVNDREGAS